MDLFANLTDVDTPPGPWAAAREAEGFDGVVCSDHYWLSGGRGDHGFPHVWVTLATMAAATERVTLASSFANNLLRSPVEFAQACLALQRDSGGRSEAGLGAGWAEDELRRTGQDYPPPGDRAGRYVEAVTIAGELLRSGRCSFSGRYYEVDVPALGPLTDPPPLVAAVGGPRTMREVTPLVDRVELKMGRTTQGGSSDLGALATVTRDEVRSMVDAVQAAKPGIPVGMLAFVSVSVGDSPAVRGFSELLGDGLYGSFVGEPGPVSEALLGLADLGIDRLQLTEFAPGSLAALAPVLLEARRSCEPEVVDPGTQDDGRRR